MDESGHDSLPGTNEMDHGSPPEGADDIDHEFLPEGKDEIDHESLPPADDSDHKGVAILLVGNKPEDKGGVVDSLTKSGMWKDRKTAVDKENGSSPARVIVDTTPLRNSSGKSPVAIARRWISQNALRRILFGKDVVVVCVVTCRVLNTCKWDMFSYSSCWVDIFSLIFKAHRAAIMVLVNTEEEVPEEIKEGVARFVLEHGLSPKNIIYSNLNKRDDSVSRVIEESIRQSPQDSRPYWNGVGSSRKASEREGLAKDGRRPPKWKSCWQPSKGLPDTNYGDRTIMPFRISKAFSQEYEALSQAERLTKYKASYAKAKYDSWGPERVILFGLTGSGKSTLAQMLTLGKLDKDNKAFDRSSDIRGKTKSIQAGVGRGWYVVDTPGFGEPDDQQSTIPTRRVQVKIKDHVRVVEGAFSHYMYVVKKDRLDVLDQNLWQFFTSLFGAEIKQQFTVVVSGADEEWVQENISALEACFVGCTSFLSADFPDIDKEDEEVENENQNIRTESLAKLEERLATLNRTDVFCKYGKYAKTNISIETVRAYMDLNIERSERIKFFVRGASMLFACCNISLRLFSKLTHMLTVHHNIILIPE